MISKMIAIQEAKDLNNLPLEELLGSLMTYGLMMKHHKKEEESRKKKTIALKFMEQDKDETEQDEDETEQSEDGDDDKVMALITRKFKWFISRRGQGMRKKPMAKGDPSKKKEKEQLLECYECKRIGYFKVDCPMFKKAPKKPKKRAMIANWRDNDESSLEEEA